jgi:hypothetical protein
VQPPEVIGGAARDVFLRERSCEFGRAIEKLGLAYFYDTNMRKNEMAEKKMPHPSHEEHLCYLQNIGFVESNMKEYKELVRNPKYVCGNCGRAAADAGNLCKPEKL